MPKIKLTDLQKEILRSMVESVNDGYDKPFIPVKLGNEPDDLLYTKGIPKTNNLIGELDILTKKGLLSKNFNSKSQPIYTVRQEGIEAVQNDFEFPEEQLTAMVNIGAIIGNMGGGSLQAVGYAENSTINQQFNTKEAFDSEIDHIADQLIESVKKELANNLLHPYLTALEELKSELKAEKPNESTLKKLIGILGFFGDIEGNISLVTRAMPYILILLDMVMKAKVG